MSTAPRLQTVPTLNPNPLAGEPVEERTHLTTQGRGHAMQYERWCLAAATADRLEARLRRYADVRVKWCTESHRAKHGGHLAFPESITAQLRAAWRLIHGLTEDST